MKHSTLLFASLLVAAAAGLPQTETAVPTSPSCPEGAHLFQGSCFLHDYGDDYTWEGAQAACAEHGMQIASVHSQAEQDFIWGLAYNSFAWIGVTDLAREGDFTWLDGTAMDYTNWYSGQPDGGDAENCGYIYGDKGGKWGDRICDHPSLSVVCRGVPT